MDQRMEQLQNSMEKKMEQLQNSILVMILYTLDDKFPKGHIKTQ
jgi:hypothetical protein